MNATITSAEGKMILTIEGRIDTTSAKDFETAIQPLMAGDAPNIELDCTNFTYISSSGLRVFLILQKSVIARNGQMVIKNMNADVKEVFTITGFASIFTIE